MVKRHIPPIVAEGVRLRLLREADLPLTLRWRNQDHIRRWFFHSEPIAPDQHHAWYERYRERDDDFVFVIERPDAPPQPVGQVALYGIDWAARRGEYGRLMIGEPAAAKKGLARVATAALLKAAFAWGLDEIYLEVLADNARALAVYHACGFAVTQADQRVIKMSCRRPAGPCGAQGD